MAFLITAMVCLLMASTSTVPHISPSSVLSDLELREVNRQFYDSLWTDARLVRPERFNTWPLICSLVSPSQRRLEVAPGLRPRLPLQGTNFVDTSAPAVAKLCAQ